MGMNNLIPEVTLKRLIDFFIDNLTEDYLYLLFGNTELNGYRFFEEAKQIFLSPSDYPRRVETHLFFNRERAPLPTIHIGMPGETPGEGDGIGFDPSTVIDGFLEDHYRDTFTRTYSARHSIVLTSLNTFEVLVMYYTLKSFFQGNYILLELNGFKNPKFSGEDIMFGPDITPTPLYSRRFLIDSFQEYEAPSIDTKIIPKSIELEFVNNCTK